MKETYAETFKELQRIEEEINILSSKIRSRTLELKADVITTRIDPIITDLWHNLCRYHRKAIVLCTGLGNEKPQICDRLETPQACIEALHLSEEETCCEVFRQKLLTKTREEMKVKYHMSSPALTIDPKANVRDSMELMRKHEVGSLLIVKKGRIEGIVTERDLITRVFAALRRPDEVIVREIMTEAPLVTLDPETDMEKAAKIMSENNVRHLPVFEKGRLVGMLAIPDFYRE